VCSNRTVLSKCSSRECACLRLETLCMEAFFTWMCKTKDFIVSRPCQSASVSAYLNYTFTTAWIGRRMRMWLCMMNYKRTWTELLQRIVRTITSSGCRICDRIQVSTSRINSAAMFGSCVRLWLGCTWNYKHLTLLRHFLTSEYPWHIISAALVPVQGSTNGTRYAC
jgi:hypothetical protein